LVYIEGTNLADRADAIADTQVAVSGVDGDGADLTLDLAVTEGSATSVTAQAPEDAYGQLPNGGTLITTTPCGSAEHDVDVFFVEENGFGGGAGTGQGLVGTVYQLKPDTHQLPDFSDPCADDSVVSSADVPCPFTTILVPNLDVPQQSFSEGFPGSGEVLVEWFAIRFNGYLLVDLAGTYRLATRSDDGSNLYLTLIEDEEACTGLGGTFGGGECVVKVVSNDGIHSMWKQTGTIDLEAGSYPITIDYFQGPRYDIGLQFSWTVPGSGEVIVPVENLNLPE